MRLRRIGLGLLVGIFTIGEPRLADAATKTTKASPRTTNGRLLPDYAELPVAILVRRAAQSRGAREVFGTLRFIQPEITPPEGVYGLKGRIDFSRRLADLNVTIEGSPERYVYVDSAAYQKVDSAAIAEVGGSWVRSSPGTGAVPAGAILMEITFATPGMVSSVANWKDNSTKSDKQKGVRRLRGTGSLEAVSAYLSPDRYKDSVAVEALIDRRGSITAVKWRLEPLDGADAAEPVEFLNTYTPAKSPITVTAPEDGVVEYGDVVETQTPSS